MSKKILDVLIVGVDFESLYLASRLKQEGFSVHLIDEEDHLQESPFLKPNDSFFNQTHDLFVAVQEVQNEVKTYENAKWKPFLGFGEKKVDFDFSMFLSSQHYIWQKDKETYTQELLDELKNQVELQAKITAIVLDENEDKIEAIETNDKKRWQAKCFIWTKHFKNIGDHLSVEAAGAKNLQKIAKATFWTRLDLHLLHKGNEDYPLNQPFLLMGGTPEARPFYGQFYKNPEGEVCSQWSAFLASHLAESGEELGNLLREMKRQIKRPFEHIFETIKFEKIQIESDIYNTFDTPLDKALAWTKLNNALLFNHSFHRFVHRQNSPELAENFLEVDSSYLKKQEEMAR